MRLVLVVAAMLLALGAGVGVLGVGSADAKLITKNGCYKPMFGFLPNCGYLEARASVKTPRSVPAH